MKKLLTSFLAAAALCTFAVSSATAKEVIIANGCDFPLHAIGLSLASASETENLLSAPLAPGDGIKVDLKVTKGIDLTAQDNEGGQVDFSGLDLTNASKVILKSDGTADIE
jgi:hypothetical protein